VTAENEAGKRWANSRLRILQKVVKVIQREVWQQDNKKKKKPFPQIHSNLSDLGKVGEILFGEGMGVNQ
jgi:hypothetical protein